MGVTLKIPWTEERVYPIHWNRHFTQDLPIAMEQVITRDEVNFLMQAVDDYDPALIYVGPKAFVVFLFYDSTYNSYINPAYVVKRSEQLNRGMNLANIGDFKRINWVEVAEAVSDGNND